MYLRPNVCITGAAIGITALGTCHLMISAEKMIKKTEIVVEYGLLILNWLHLKKMHITSLKLWGCCQGAFSRTAVFWSLLIFWYLHSLSAHVTTIAAQFPDAAIAMWPTFSTVIATNTGASYGVTLQGSCSTFKPIAVACLTRVCCLVVVLHWLTRWWRRGWSTSTAVIYRKELQRYIPLMRKSSNWV